MKITDLIDEVAIRIKLPLELNAKGQCRLRDSESKLVFTLECPENAKLFYIYTPICELAAVPNPEIFLRSLLSLNLLGIQSKGLTISLDTTHNKIVAHIALPKEILTPELLENFINNTILAARVLKKKIEDLEDQAYRSDHQTKAKIPLQEATIPISTPTSSSHLKIMRI